MEKINDIILEIIKVILALVVPALMIYGIFFYYPSVHENDLREHYYLSTYEVHYIDGPTDTAYVAGPYSNEKSVDYTTTTNYNNGNGYNFCGVQGICRVRLLGYHKITTFGDVYYDNIKFKNNK